MIFDLSIENCDLMTRVESAKRRYNVISTTSDNMNMQFEPYELSSNKFNIEPINGSLIHVFADTNLPDPNTDNHIVSSEEESSVDELPKKKRRISKNYSNKFRPYQAEKWQERFDELIEFQKEQGHCLVPHTYPSNAALARWVKRQRYQYKLLQEGKQSSMTQDRIKILQDIGFVWDSHEAAWQERLSELLEFKTEYGNCLVPSNCPERPQLATWVKCQRRQYKLYWEGRPSNMTVERIMVLEKNGFEWELRSSSFSKKAAEQEAKALNSLLPLEAEGEYGLLMDFLSDLTDEDDASLLEL